MQWVCLSHGGSTLPQFTLPAQNSQTRTPGDFLGCVLSGGHSETNELKAEERSQKENWRLWDGGAENSLPMCPDIFRKPNRVNKLGQMQVILEDVLQRLDSLGGKIKWLSREQRQGTNSMVSNCCRTVGSVPSELGWISFSSSGFDCSCPKLPFLNKIAILTCRYLTVWPFKEAEQCTKRY